MKLYEELQRRGLIKQITDESKTEELLNDETVVFYIGFDATADSLHIGHLLQLVTMKRLQDYGHKPIALLGTGTTLVGDPTGRTDMRKMLSEDKIEKNALNFKTQMSKFIDFDDNKALMIKNGDWLKSLNYIDFLRTVGKHFSVNKMLTAECIKTRFKNGLSFLEFNYMLMQSYDFLKLYESYGCIMEMGGDDQWSNILGGIDLIRRVKNKKVYGLTFPLLTTKDGKKMGKTAKGAVWLDDKKYSPYEFFQYFRNIADQDVFSVFKKLTFVPIEQIEDWETHPKGDINKYKEKLAYELTKLVHGETEADKSLEASCALFKDKSSSSNMPSFTINKNEFKNGSLGILRALVLSGLSTSNAEARRLIKQGGITVNDKKVCDPNLFLDQNLIEKGIIVRKGKKTFVKISF